MKNLAAAGAAIFFLAHPAFGQTASQPSLEASGASLTLKVRSFPEAADKAKEAAVKAGGRLTDSSSMVHPTGRKSGWVKLSVPAAKLQEVLAGLRSEGIPAGESIILTDYRGEIRELNSKIEHLHTHQQRLSTLLTRRNIRASDALFIQERLLRSEMDSSNMARRIDSLKDNVGTSTIDLTLFEPATEMKVHGDTLKGRAAGAWEESTKNLGASIGSSAGWLVSFLLHSPPWIIGFGILYWLYRRNKEKIAKLFASPRAPQPPAPTEPS